MTILKRGAEEMLLKKLDNMLISIDLCKVDHSGYPQILWSNEKKIILLIFYLKKISSPCIMYYKRS